MNGHRSCKELKENIDAKTSVLIASEVGAGENYGRTHGGGDDDGDNGGMDDRRQQKMVETSK